MPSIFIWKSDEPNNSTKNIKFYSGSNWSLEENGNISKSYIYLEQIVISESNNSVITFQSKDMPKDWVGSELLEVICVPYELVKSDNYGKLEKIGDWMRFTTNIEIEFNIANLKNEFISINNWISNKNTDILNNTHLHSNLITKTNNSDILINLENIQHNFNQFLNNYNTSNLFNDIVVDNSINNINISRKYKNNIYNKNKLNRNKLNRNKLNRNTLNTTYI